MGGISKLLETKSEKMRADAVLCERYAQTGAQFFEILRNINRPYLDVVENFSEVANMLYWSTYHQYVYSLKLNRKLTQEEEKALAHTIRRELAKAYGMAIDEFAKKWVIQVTGENIFFRDL